MTEFEKFISKVNLKSDIESLERLQQSGDLYSIVGYVLNCLEVDYHETAAQALTKEAMDHVVSCMISQSD
jgi:hypothetical protein